MGLAGWIRFVERICSLEKMSNVKANIANNIGELRKHHAEQKSPDLKKRVHTV